MSVDGTSADMLARDLSSARAFDAPRAVQLLPAFDPYLMGHRSRDHLFDRVHAPKVSRIAGWISAVVLVDGRVAGTWTHTRADDELRISVAPFRPLAPRVRAEVERRAWIIASAVGASRVEVRMSR